MPIENGFAILIGGDTAVLAVRNAHQSQWNLAMDVHTVGLIAKMVLAWPP